MMSMERQYERFWSALVELSNEKTDLFQHFFGDKQGSYIEALSGEGGIRFRYTLLVKPPNTAKGMAHVALCIDLGNAEKNRHALDVLYARRDEIQRQFGDGLQWYYPIAKDRQAYIWYSLSCGGLQAYSCWHVIQEAMVDSMVRLEQALKPHIQGLSIPPEERTSEQRWNEAFARSSDVLEQLAEDALDELYGEKKEGSSFART